MSPPSGTAGSEAPAAESGTSAYLQDFCYVYHHADACQTLGHAKELSADERRKALQEALSLRNVFCALKTRWRDCEYVIDLLYDIGQKDDAQRVAKTACSEGDLCFYVAVLADRFADAGDKATATSLENFANYQECNAGDGTACMTLGFSVAEQGDPQKAMQYFRTGCAKSLEKPAESSSTACLGYARQLLAMGDNYDAARDVLRQACTVKKDLCDILADEARKHKDLGTALTAYRPLCDKGDTEACNSMAAIELDLGNYSAARTIFQKLCTSTKAGVYCYNVGLASVKEKNLPQARKDFVRARTALTTECEDGDNHACTILQELTGYGF